MTSLQTHFDVIIIGGGASGMMAAVSAGVRGRSVLVLEKNPQVGKKLDITGGGRCNITNANGTVREFLARYGESQHFLFSPFSKFSAADTFTFFESQGLKLKTEEHGRAFPVSEKATDVTRILADQMKAHGVTVLTNAPVTAVHARDGKITEVVTKQATYTAESIVLATGGISHPETGSTGDGFAWLRALGHVIKEPNATLVPLKVTEKWVHALAGVTLQNMKITFYANGMHAFSKTGRLLFTHFGISGPLILNSAKDVSELLKNKVQVTATIDLFPELNSAELDHRVLFIIESNKNKLFRNIISEIVPAGMSDAVTKLFALADPDLKAHSLTQEDRKRFVHLLKGLPLHIEGLMGLDRSIVSDGGLSLDEVDTRTMRSRKVENLFLTGDILNVNRPSGGYSLQLCWTTGWVAGQSA
jgi:predicted Rossmann fold flavoprotein